MFGNISSPTEPSGTCLFHIEYQFYLREKINLCAWVLIYFRDHVYDFCVVFSSKKLISQMYVVPALSNDPTQRFLGSYQWLQQQDQPK